MTSIIIDIIDEQTDQRTSRQRNICSRIDRNRILRDEAVSPQLPDPVLPGKQENYLINDPD